MVAGCFPALKPLFRTLLAGRSSDKSRKTYGRDGYIRNIDNSGVRRTFKSHNTVNEFEMYGREGHQADVVAGRMGSTESILQADVQASRSDGITKTTHVVVTVDEQQEKSVKNLV